MEIISHKEFEKFRLKNFVNRPKEIVKLSDWEFMGDTWKGEAIGFTECLSLKREARKTKSLSLNFSDLSQEELSKIFQYLKLPISNGMTLNEIEDILGKPINIEIFVDDRKTYEFIIGSSDEYYLSCTILNNGGLTYLVLMNHEKTIQELKSNSG